MKEDYQVKVLRIIAEEGGRAVKRVIWDALGNSRADLLGETLHELKHAGVLRLSYEGDKRLRHVWELVTWPDWAGVRPAVPELSPRFKPARRRCLTCREHFDSTDCGNRICPGCKGPVNHAAGGLDDSVSGGGRVGRHRV